MKLIKKNHYKEFRPTCINEGCDRVVQTRRINKNRTYDIRAECYKCHAGFRNRPGVIPHKKTYCENRDGRLGFVCTTNIVNKITEMGTIWYGMLDVDHIDGDPSNDTAENCQTFCKCCHAYKTHINGDTGTPGRKTLKIKMNFKKNKN